VDAFGFEPLEMSKRCSHMSASNTIGGGLSPQKVFHSGKPGQ
jgi:hypothetical protein